VAETDDDDYDKNAVEVLMPKIIISKNLKYYCASGSQNLQNLKGA